MTTYIHGVPARFYTSGEIRLVTTHVDGKRLISDEELREIVGAAWKRYQAFLANKKIDELHLCNDDFRIHRDDCQQNSAAIGPQPIPTNRIGTGRQMSHDSAIAKLQEVIRELHNMDVTAASAAPLAPRPANPLPPLPQPQPQPQPAVSAANWMAQYQSDCLLWATALQHGVVTQHPDSNEYRNGNYNWPDREKAMNGQSGTPTRPGGTSGNQPRAI